MRRRERKKIEMREVYLRFHKSGSDISTLSPEDQENMRIIEARSKLRGESPR